MQPPRRPMLRLFNYLNLYAANLWFSVSSSVINKLFDLMPPFLTAWVIDTVSGNTPNWISKGLGLSDAWSAIIFLVALTLIIFIFESFFEWLFKRGFMRLAQNVQHSLRINAYRHLQNREIAFFEEQRTGNLMAMLNDDINQLERFLNNVFNEIIQLITLLIFASWSLSAVSLELGLIGMAPIPFIIIGSFYYQRKVAPFYKEIREGVGQLSNRLENNLSGIMVIKSFTAENFETQRVQQASGIYRDANFKAIRWSSVYIPIIRIFIALGFAATMLIGAYWVLFFPDRFTYGNLAFFAMMIQRLLWPVTRLGVIFDEYERARASARRIFGLLDSPNRIKNPLSPVQIPNGLSHIKFSNVSFSYNNGSKILDHLNLEIQAGQSVGIAGPTGGGKTTLIKLLLRFYDANSGSITINDADLRDLQLTELRKNIALVSQDIYLFHGSIRENIAYGMGEVPLEAIILAAEKAQMHDFINSLPNKYDTLIGERGIKLSGGQRQRLSLARAILKDAPILILDEATSAVDTETERAIQISIQKLIRHKTSIIIAHRLSTIRNTDKIAVIQDGKVVEEGPHDVLLAQKGLYAELWRIQTGEFIQIEESE